MAGSRERTTIAYSLRYMQWEQIWRVLHGTRALPEHRNKAQMDVHRGTDENNVCLRRVTCRSTFWVIPSRKRCSALVYSETGSGWCDCAGNSHIIRSTTWCRVYSSSDISCWQSKYSISSGVALSFLQPERMIKTSRRLDKTQKTNDLTLSNPSNHLHPTIKPNLTMPEVLPLSWGSSPPA